ESTRRSAGWARSRVTSANSSSRTRPRAPSRAARAKASSAPSRATRNTRRTVSATGASSGRASAVPAAVAAAVRGLAGQLVDVGIDQGQLAVAVERPPDDALGHVNGQLPDLAAELPGR